MRQHRNGIGIVRWLLNRWFGSGLGVASCFCGLALAAFPIAGYAQEPRSIADSVYSTGQAERGQQIYRTQCAECHGEAMEGAAGPPLVGEFFLSNWSGRPLEDLVEKTRLTMPFQLPMTLSRQESADLVAYMLQGGEFPAGQAELSDATLPGIGFPTVAAAPGAGPTTGTVSLVPPEGNLAELMRAIHFPNSNIIFNVQLGDPATRPVREPSPLSFDYVEWGATIYPGWLAVDQAAVAIVDTAPLLLMPGRRCQNGRPMPVDRPDWIQFVDDMVEAGMFARRASQARDYEAFDEVSNRLNASCANCHMAYRDGDGPEGGGAARCQ